MTTEKSDNRDAGPSEIERRAARDLGGAARKLQHDVDATIEKASHEAEALKSQAEEKIGEASQGAKSFASDQKNLAAAQITGIASAISKVADELNDEQATTARYARDLAEGLDSFGKEIEGKSVDELVGDAQNFGRTQPLAFLGAAALAGFAASRFAGASAQRRQTNSGNPVSGRTTPSGAAYGRPNAGGDDGTGAGSPYGKSSSSYAGGGNVTG